MPDVLSEQVVLTLPPMLFGRIRWKKGLGAPVGDPATGFRVWVEEHTVSQFRMGPSGPEVIPGTGVWRPREAVQCVAAPEEGDTHVVSFNVPGVHLNGFPDGKYRVTAELTGNWTESPMERMFGYRRIEPFSWYVVLTRDKHIAVVDFEVVLEPWRIRLFG